MAQPATAQRDLAPAADAPPMQQSPWKKWFGLGNGAAGAGEKPQDGHEPQRRGEEPHSGVIRRVSRKVVPGLPRAQTFKRQQAEVRNNLEPVQPTPAERRALSVDRRPHLPTSSINHSNPRASAPDFGGPDVFSCTLSAPSIAGSVIEEKMLESIGDLNMPEHDEVSQAVETASDDDAASMTTSQYDNLIHDELERIWILNLSMQFRDRSKREKFFVTYREKEEHWRRVTVSLDYRGAPDNSLEMDLMQIKFQRDKSAKIYEAIRDSLQDIQFYDSVTNLKLQTTDGRLHVHVVEDVNEIIHYPTVRMIQHLRCRHVRERDIDFGAHMSGFVYKVRVKGETLIKKEIPGPDTVDEFLYEINALSQLSSSRNVIRFYGVILDDYGEYVKGLLISYADQGALIDIIYDHDHGLPWPRREKWARQIVEGLSEVHEAGFVQGDFTLSNIVVDEYDNAKIIDINRRGCPVGWEPPEATPLIESSQRISMYIGVKSDLYQLGMVLWALAEQEDEPESHGRPLTLSHDLDVPDWYKALVRLCLADNPRHRMQAIDLLRLFPPRPGPGENEPPSISVDDGYLVQDYLVSEFPTGNGPIIKTVLAPSEWNQGDSYEHTYVDRPYADAPSTLSSEPYYYPTRGRSPPSPMPSNLDYCEPRWAPQVPWSNPRERTFERQRSSSGLELTPGALVPGDEDGSVSQLMRGNSTSKRTRIEDTVPRPTDTGDDLAAPGERDAGEKDADVHRSEDDVVTASTLSQAHLDKSRPDEGDGAGPLAEEQHETNAEVPSNTALVHPGDDGTTAQQNEGDAFRSNLTGHGAHDFPSSNTNDDSTNNNTTTTTQSPAQNPLFQEARTTERDAPSKPAPAALGPRAAQVQNTTSANTVLDTKQDPRQTTTDDSRVDSAIEMMMTTTTSHCDSTTTTTTKSPLSPSSSSSCVPDALLHLGSGHHSTEDADVAIRKDSASTIAEDDL
ncbi:unnamed protein product [Discula destructiva]